MAVLVGVALPLDMARDDGFQWRALQILLVFLGLDELHALQYVGVGQNSVIIVAIALNYIFNVALP